MSFSCADHYFAPSRAAVPDHRPRAVAKRKRARAHRAVFPEEAREGAKWAKGWDSVLEAERACRDVFTFASFAPSRATCLSHEHQRRLLAERTAHGWGFTYHPGGRGFFFNGSNNGQELARLVEPSLALTIAQQFAVLASLRCIRKPERKLMVGN